MLPPELLVSLENVQGFDRAGFCEVHNSGSKITSIRVNPAKSFDPIDHFKGAEQIPWSSHGFYLKDRPSFTTDPLFHAGAYYVQEAGSMFLEEAIKQTVDLSGPLRVLDLCASPGGKSTLLQSIISSESLLVSNEIIKTRVGTLTDNITKWGAANVVVTNNDAKDFQRLPSFFDVIVVDAPCSGSGLFRKDNEAIDEWSLENVSHCSIRQQRILEDILPALKPNGILIYSTCSYSEEENEQVTDILFDKHSMESLRIHTEETGIIETRSGLHNCYGYRFYPNKIKSEGFYIAAFRYNGVEPCDVKEKRSTLSPIPKSDMAILIKYLKDTDHFFFIKQKEDILGIPAVLAKGLQLIQANLYIKKAGVKIGCLIRNELIPAHDLALSGLASEVFPHIDLDHFTALNYLRKREIVLQTPIKGWALIRYDKMNLGFIKVLPGRINNYYPKDLRILNM